MANYEHLPIFKSCYDYIIEIYLRTKNFPKEYKYTIWEKLKSVWLELLLGINELNSLSDKELKKVLIHRCIKFAEMCKMLTRISKDINIVHLKILKYCL